MANIDFNGSYSLRDPETLKQYAAKLDETTQQFVASCAKVSSSFQNISQYLNCSNTQMGQDIAELVEVYNALVEKSHIRFQDLVQKMNTWANLTIQLEQETVQKINQLNSGLNDIHGLINSMK